MQTKRQSRRRFLRTAALAAGGLSLACCGLTVVAATQAAPQGADAPVETPRFTFGKDNAVEKRILVAYATRTGSTVGVAEAIGRTLGERGFAVDVRPVRDDPDPAAYQAVILGSAINGGRWLPEALEYAANHRQALQPLPTALFCVHAMNLGADAASVRRRKAYLDPVRPLLPAAHEAFFAGMGMDEKTGPLLRWVVRTFNLVAEGDCRDWTKIRAWGQAVFAGKD